MAHEMMIALKIIFGLFVLMIVRIACRIRKKRGRSMGKKYRKLLRWE